MKSGFFFMYDDMQVIRLQQMDLCVKDGQIPCRWVPDLGYGYGYPLYQYYAPLPYYVMEGVHLFDVSYIDSVKTGFVLSIVLSAVFFFLFVRHLFSLQTSLAATLLYVYSPIRAADLYVRGAMGELWGLFAIPFVFWGIENHLGKRSKKSLGIFVLTLGVLLVTHNLSVLMILPLVLFWIIFRIYHLKIKDLKSVFVQFFVGGLLAFLLTGFFTIPLIFESSQVYLETLTQGYFNYINHFADLKQLGYETYRGLWVLKYPLVELLSLWAKVFLQYDIAQESPKFTATQIRVPVLILHSKNDDQISFRHAEILQESLTDNQNAEYYFFDNAVHGQLPVDYQNRVDSFFSAAFE